MAVVTHVLVVANQTVGAAPLHVALTGRAARGPIHVTLLVPAAWSQREAARARLTSALAALESAGIPAAGELGDADPIVAVQEAWNPGRFDEIVVSTLAEGTSRWLQIGLPQRVSRLTDCPVAHVEVRAAAPRAPVRRPPPRPRRGAVDTVLSFLQTTPPR
ncbi:MAG: hypothetical protein ABI950_11460 [Solirubrobacteraceae bacterium]